MEDTSSLKNSGEGYIPPPEIWDIRKNNGSTFLRTFSRSRRSFLAQLRLMILPLEIETRRYTPIYNIMCVIWARVKWRWSSFLIIVSSMPGFETALDRSYFESNYNSSSLSNYDKVLYLLQNCRHEIMSYVQKAWERRSLTP